MSLLRLEIGFICNDCGKATSRFAEDGLDKFKALGKCLSDLTCAECDAKAA